MSQRKQVLLKEFRRKKRLSLLAILILLLAISTYISWHLAPIALLCFWLIHEAWFADHIFYQTRQDYSYLFPDDNQSHALTIHNHLLDLSTLCLPENATLILEISIKSSILGHLFDPKILISDDQQTFARGSCGRRFINLTGQDCTQALLIKGRFCRIKSQVQLFAFNTLNLHDKRLMILAPHADDAEIAAFGLYSQQAENSSVITLTQGEVEPRRYQEMFNLPAAQAAKLKGRLRTWDSLAIPLWGNIKPSHCIQLGYYCMQLPNMLEQPEKPFASSASGEADIRAAHQHNAFVLPSDKNGLPTGENLVADLAVCLMHFQPDVVVLPHPEIDPHPDHIACYQALILANQKSTFKVPDLLLYANHLHDNDLWPMGESHTGIALPPMFDGFKSDAIASFHLPHAVQINKAMALLMQHDLQTPLSFKHQLRRKIQRLLTGRHWPKSGTDDYLRRAVRKHELFWHRRL